MAIRTKSLLIMARIAVGLFGAQIESMRENEIQIVYTLFDQRQLAIWRRPIFRNAANQTTASELRGGFGVANLAEILGMANGAIVRRAIDAHQTFVLLRPRHALMRQRQQCFNFAVARLAGGFGFYIIMAGAAGRHHRQKGQARLFGSFDASVTGGTFLLLAFDVTLVAETDFALGRRCGFNVFRIKMAILAVALDFRAVTSAALFVGRQHGVIGIFAGLHCRMAHGALGAYYLEVKLVRKFDLGHRTVPRRPLVETVNGDDHSGNRG